MQFWLGDFCFSRSRRRVFRASPTTENRSTSPSCAQQYPVYVYPTSIPWVYVNPAPVGSQHFPWYFGHYHIRDWTTGIEKPSYAVSKPWLDVRQYP